MYNWLTITYFQYVLQSLRALGAAEAPQQHRSVAVMKPLPPPAPRGSGTAKAPCSKRAAESQESSYFLSLLLFLKALLC